MTKADIVNIVARETGLTKVDTQAVVEGFLATIMDALHKGERVDFRGFGNFSLKVRKPKIARNPGTGEEIPVPERYVPVFKPAKSLKDSVNAELNK